MRLRPENLNNLPGVGAKRAHALQSAEIFTVADLLEYFPRDYDDRSKVKAVAELLPNAVNTIRGVVSREPESATLRRKGGGGTFSVTKIHIYDETGTLELVWFNQPYMKKNFVKGEEYIFTGRVREVFGASRAGILLQMQSPEYERAGGDELSGGRIVPIYTPPKGFSQKVFRKLIFSALQCSGPVAAQKTPRCSPMHPGPVAAQKTPRCSPMHPGPRGLGPLAGVWGQSPRGLEKLKLSQNESTSDTRRLVLDENLPTDVLARYGLCGRGDAIWNIHFPENDEKFFAARRRLVFEELYFLQIALLDLKRVRRAQKGIFFADTDFGAFLERLEFELTAAQGRVLGEIVGDLAGGGRLNRLVQGDVGSGKTAVAFAAAFLAAKNGFQAAIMVPTDVLATQHFAACGRVFAPLGVEAVLLTGSLNAAARREALAKISSGAAKIVVGTHALIQDAVEFHSLALCITDEQHRFGVNQRLALVGKGGQPHVLVMSATPIPRTLGLILYGDLDISVIDELPPGRAPIKTYRVNSAYRERIFAFIKKEAAAGRQAYVICPVIEEGETDLRDVAGYARELADALPDVTVAHLHGRMKAAEKAAVMDAFKAGEVQVIVTTTVIEVGVHVANASLIIIENAERFGLSQLHQLRGRVGRGTAQSYCVLVTDSKNENTAARMDAMVETTDGFRLAELDLKQRGVGDFFGTRQHGLPSFKIANLYRDLDVLKAAQEAARGNLHASQKV